MAHRDTPGRAAAGGLRGRRRDRLVAGQTYFDLDHPENGPFVATGDEQVAPTSNFVAQEELSDDAWAELVGDGFGEIKSGGGDRAYDQGAFGQEDNPRGDVLNSAPPGTGEGLTPHETEEEQPGR